MLACCLQAGGVHGSGFASRACSSSRLVLASRPWVQRHAAGALQRQQRMATKAQAKQKGKQKEDSACPACHCLDAPGLHFSITLLAGNSCFHQPAVC